MTQQTSPRDSVAEVSVQARRPVLIMIIAANTTYASVCLSFGGNAVWQGAIIGMARIHLSLRVCSITDSILDLHVEVDAVPKASDQFCISSKCP